MNRKELLSAAEANLGAKIPPHILTYARMTGRLAVEPQKVRGWLSYKPEAVAQLVDYVQRCSRIELDKANQLTQPWGSINDNGN